jgi:hypothetical protein
MNNDDREAASPSHPTETPQHDRRRREMPKIDICANCKSRPVSEVIAFFAA